MTRFQVARRRAMHARNLRAHDQGWRAANDEPDVFGPARGLLTALSLTIVLWLAMGGLMLWFVDILAAA